MKAAPRKRRRAKKVDSVVKLLAGFLNLDVEPAVDDMKRGAWHKYQSWPRNGIPDGITTADLKRYGELEAVVRLLDEWDIYQPVLVNQLKRLQDEVRARLQPIIERDETRIRGLVQLLVAELNRRQFRAQWALYAHGEVMGMDWARTYNPENPSYVDPADPDLFMNQRRFEIGKHEYVVKPVFSRPAPATDNSPNRRFDLISNRLYWLIGQMLVDATIGTLRMCDRCDKYFGAYDGKQKYCSPACAKMSNDEGKLERAAKSKRKKRAIANIGRFRRHVRNDSSRADDILSRLGNGSIEAGRNVVKAWKGKSDAVIWDELRSSLRDKFINLPK
jgi:hypothetical protein